MIITCNFQWTCLHFALDYKPQSIHLSLLSAGYFIMLIFVSIGISSMRDVTDVSKSLIKLRNLILTIM